MFWVIGSFLYAIAINVFTAPNNILIGGFSGVATMLNYLFGLPIGTVIFVLNIPFFIISFYKFGYKFIIKTLIATLIASVLIDTTAPFLSAYTGDKLLSSIYGGVLAGAGLGIVFLRGATTGGTDIIAKLLRLKFTHISMGRVILFLDLIIIAVSFFVYGSIESMLYALVVIFVSSQAIDYTISGTDHSKIVYIVTDLSDVVSNKIMTELNRGVTEIPVVGGYTKTDKRMLFCAVKAQEISNFEKAIKEVDENCFMVVSEANEILGEGFRHSEI